MSQRGGNAGPISVFVLILIGMFAFGAVLLRFV